MPRTEVQREMTIPRGELGRRRWVLERAGGLPWAAGLGRALSPLTFLLGCVLLIHALAYVSDRLAPDWNTRFLQVDREHTAKILKSAAVIDALALGNSHTGSLDMASLGYAKGYRFPRADGDLFETRYYLEYLIPRMAKVKTVFIPISYFSFLVDNRAAAEVEIRRAHMYASLPTWRALPGDFKNLLIGKSHTYLPLLRIVRPDNWEAVFYTLLGSPPEENGFIEVAAGDCSHLDPDTLEASVENRVAKYMRLTQEMSARHPGLAGDAYETVAAIQSYLKAQGVRLVFFTPPYLKAYNDHYQAQDPETIALMRSSMERLQSEHGVEYYDFSRDESFSLDPTLFKDSDHLNACGAAKFSAALRERMQ